MRAERRIGIARSPCHLHIDQRIMRDIKRIGYFAEEFADGDGFGIRDAASGTHRDDQREDEQDHQRLIDAVEPRCRGIADMRHDQRRRNEQRTPPESAPHPDQRPEAREQQSREKGVQQAREADVNLLRSDTPSADDGPCHGTVGRKQAEEIEVQREIEGQHRGCGHEEAEQEFRKTADDERIENVGYVLVEQRPCGTVQRTGFAPPADVPRRRRGEDRAGEQADQQHFPPRHVGNHRKRCGLEVEEERPDDRPHDDHRMQADEPPLEEIFERHAVPAVVVGIADDEARKHEEEIDGQIAVVENLESLSPGVGLEEVEGHHDQRRHAAKSVEDLVAGFGGQITGRGCSHRLTLRRFGWIESCRRDGCRRSRPILRPLVRSRYGGRRDVGCFRGCGR